MVCYCEAAWLDSSSSFQLLVWQCMFGCIQYNVLTCPNTSKVWNQTLVKAIVEVTWLRCCTEVLWMLSVFGTNRPFRLRRVDLDSKFWSHFRFHHSTILFDFRIIRLPDSRVSTALIGFQCALRCSQLLDHNRTNLTLPRILFISPEREANSQNMTHFWFPFNVQTLQSDDQTMPNDF